MDARAASDNLQVIRTLMERAALYRRALAPIMLSAGTLGTVAAALGVLLNLYSPRAFVLLWMGTAIATVAIAFLLARRQALKDHEPFWSPPTRRVAQALLPALSSGMFLGLLFLFADAPEELGILLTLLWILFYGCALHAAGFFMVRGMRLFGWLFIAGAAIVLVFCAVADLELSGTRAHILMGVFFGLLHLLYGGYLYATEKRKNAA
jgi:hypothetical protein